MTSRMTIGGLLLAVAAAPLLIWSAPARAQMSPAEMAAQALAQAAEAERLGAEAAAASEEEARNQARVSALEEALLAAQEAAEDARERLLDLNDRQFAAEELMHQRRAEHEAAFGAMISLAKAPAPALAAYSDRPAQAARAASALSGLAEALERDARQMREALSEIDALRSEIRAARAEAVERIAAVRQEDAALKEALRQNRGRGAAAAEESERLRRESADLAQRAAQIQAAMAQAPSPPTNPRRLPPPAPFQEAAPAPGGFVAPPAPAQATDAPPLWAPPPEQEVRTAWAQPPGSMRDSERRDSERRIYGLPALGISEQRALSPVVGGRIMAGYGDVLAHGNRSDGLHFEAEAGSVVYAPFAGVVEFAAEMQMGDLGKVVVLRVDPEHQVVLAGLGEFDAKLIGRKGVPVAAGETLGRLAPPREGRTLSSLYLELRRGRAHADPSQWFGDL